MPSQSLRNRYDDQDLSLLMHVAQNAKKLGRCVFLCLFWPPLRLLATKSLMLETPLQPDDTWSKCLECAAAGTSCLWLHGLSRSTIDMINCCQHRCAVHVSSCLTWNVRRAWWTMLVHWVVRASSSPIAFRRRALQLRQGAQHSWRLPVNKMLHIMFRANQCSWN